MNEESILRPLKPIRRVHAYAASFGDDLARVLIDRHTKAGDVILDPWSGSGTSMLQARLLGREGIGIDTDPVACLIARVVTTSYAVDELDQLEFQVDNRLKSISSALGEVEFEDEQWSPGTEFSIDGFHGSLPANHEIEFWFAPIHRVLIGVLVQLARSFEAVKYQEVVELAISSAIIRKWPNSLSYAMDIDHSRPHRVVRELTVDTEIGIFQRVFKGIIRTLHQINSHPENHKTSITILESDAEEAVAGIPEDSIDYVLTSPPYFNAIDYPRAHKFSQWWLWPKHPKLSRDKYMGLRNGGQDNAIVDECFSLSSSWQYELSPLQQLPRPIFYSFCRYVLDLHSIIRGLGRALKRGKDLTFVLGNNEIRGVVLPNVDITLELLRLNGFTSVNSVRREIRSTSRRYPYGLRGFKGPMRWEYVIGAISG